MSTMNEPVAHIEDYLVNMLNEMGIAVTVELEVTPRVTAT